MKKFWLGLLVGVIGALAIPLVVLYAGGINMRASAGPGPIEQFVGTLAMEHSVAVRAPAEQNPYSGDQQAMATGREHYQEMCLLCHGAPGVEPREFAKGLTPRPPDLERSIREFSDGELFWITKHGVRMTGMPAFGPTHSDEEIWKILAFVKHLPELSEQERMQLKEAIAAGRHGHDDDQSHVHGAKMRVPSTTMNRNIDAAHE